MTYGDFKDLARRTKSDKFLRDKVIEIAKNPKYNGYQRGLGSMVNNFFDKKSSRNGIMSNQKRAIELHKPIIRKINRGKAYSLFHDNI